MSDAKFWAKVDRTGPCWIWLGARNRRGYGLHTIHRRQHLAHRLSFTTFHGEPPAGHGVLHRCDNPPCVNPDHLFSGSQALNMADCAAKERTTSTIDATTVRAIIKARLAGESTYRIAERFGITQSAVSLIVRGKHWRHIVAPHLPALSLVSCKRADAKLSPETVAEIRQLLAAGVMGKDIAARFGISRARVSEINTGKAWR